MVILLVLVGYFVGTIPFALWLARSAAGTDVRFAGSGNVGAANVFRTTRTSLALVVMVLDIAKGCAVVFFAAGMGASETARAAAGGAAIVGHIYPVWLKFRGGKGVATAFGVFGVLSPVATAVAAAAFVAVVWVTRYVSVGSVVATVLLPPLAYLAGASAPVVIGALAAATLIVYRHRSNLARLQTGTEPRLGQGT